MDLSSKPMPDEARTMDRPLYRASQTPQASKPSPPMPARSIAKPPPKPWLQRRLVRIMHLALWLLLLGGASYFIFLPDPVQRARREMRAIQQNKDLTDDQRNEERGRIFSSLSDRQRRDFRMPPELRVKIHDTYDAFFKLSPAEQAAQLRMEILDLEKRRAEVKAKMAKERAKKAVNGGRGPGSGGGPKVVGPRRGGLGGGDAVWGGRQRDDDPTRGDMLPPETWQQQGLKKDMQLQMMKQMGLR